MSQHVEQLFERLWQDYISRTPSAPKVHEVLGKGHPIVNDHVAFRTFDIAPVRLEALAQHFLDLGYGFAQAIFLPDLIFQDLADPNLINRTKTKGFNIPINKGLCRQKRIISIMVWNQNISD